MTNVLTGRFEPIRILQRDRIKLTAVGTDHLLGVSSVLIKVIRKGYFHSNRDSLANFFSWHRSIRHPNLAEILDVGLTPQKDLYTVRPYYETLGHPTNQVSFAKQLVSAISALHSGHQVHAAIRPGNVFVTDGSLKLSDPCVPNLNGSALTEDGIRFTAPEVLAGERPSAQSDLYSVGAILYRMFSDRDPFEDFDLTNLRSKYMWAAPSPLLSLANVPRSIGEAVEGLLQKDPSKRATLDDVRVVFPSFTSAQRAPFTGRAEQINRIRIFLENTPRGRLRVAFIEGEPGIGKTRFVEELRAVLKFQCAGSAIVHCRRQTDVAFGPLLEALQCLLRERVLLGKSNLQEEVGNFWTTLSQYIDKTDMGASIRTHPSELISSDIAGLLRRLAERMPFTLIIDDVDRADRWTLHVLEQLCLRAAEIPLTLVLTARSSCSELDVKSRAMNYLGENFLNINLGPLALGDTRTVLSYFATSPINTEKILNASFGNPLFLQEYALHGGTSEKLSPRLVETFQSLLEMLPKISVELAQTISIFSKPVACEVVHALSMLSDPTFGNSLEELRSAGLVLVNSSAVCFKSDGFRLRIYSHISAARRVRLHKTAYGLLRQQPIDNEVLANHAWQGRLFEDATQFCINAGNELKDRADYPSAVRFYNRALTCLQYVGRGLESDSKFNLAFCYTYIGKHAQAKKIYHELLSEQTEHGTDPGRLASVYQALAHPEFKGSLATQINLCCQAIDTAPTAWIDRVRLYALLSQLLAQSGELEAAQRALNRAKDCLTPEASPEVKGFIDATQSYVCLHSGKFREGASALKSIAATRPVTQSGVYNNVALCWEHLGDLHRAKHLQQKAQIIGASTGHALVQVLSLINLGAFETKLGKFVEADRLFTKAATLIADFRSRDKAFRPSSMSVLHLDSARLEIELGKYREAERNLGLVERADIRGMEGGCILLAKCELHICFNNTEAINEWLGLLNQSEVFKTEFFLNERALIESFLDVDTIVEVPHVLVQALEASTRIGTQYQRCKLFHRLSRILLQLGRTADAYEAAEEALRLAEKHGYSPLGAKSQLALALTSVDQQRKEIYLIEAFHAAVEIGLPELLAESAFYIATEKHKVGQQLIAEEYLIKSISKTTELAQRVPARLRSKYMAVKWRCEAPKLLEDCRARLQSSSLRTLGISHAANEKYFRALYRIAMSSRSDLGLGTFVSSLMESLDATLQRPIVLMLQTRGTYSYHSLKMKVTDDLRVRLRLISEKANGKIHFGGAGQRGETRDALAWIPLHTDHYSGGIYLYARHKDPPLGEQEIEFLTIVNRLANESLHQVENCLTQMPVQAQASHSHGIIGSSKAIKEVYSQIEIAAGNAATVLIEGESGTGKELVAKAIHAGGPRAKEAFIPVDCGAIPEGLIEAELFGAKRGAYTGAVADRPGLFEAAHRGTIFLDEISNTTPALQAKLLRVIQERKVRRIGETKDRDIDVRLVVASNQNLEALAQESRFRKDLLYRLKVLHIKVPPLRGRLDDIPMLAHAFLQKLNTSNNTKKHFAPGIVNDLSTQKFPGNVRELQNAIERAFFSAKGIVITDVPLESQSNATASIDEVQSWFKELSEGRKDFWSAIHSRYKRRDISREKVVALVDFGLRSTRGSYKTLASMFRLKDRDYRRFMDFLRRNDCLLDFRPYRQSAANVRES